MSWSRASSTVDTWSRFVSSALISSSREAMVRERAETPSSAERNSSGVLRVRSASVVSDSASWSVSMAAEVSARPEKASTTSNGEVVRSTGISAPSASCPPPFGSRERNIAPSSVLTLMAAPVSSPNSESVLTRKLTRT